MSARMTRIQRIKLANGKYEFVPADFPELPEFLRLDPNCFGLACEYELTQEEIDRTNKIFGEAEGVRAGDMAEVIFTVRNEPRRKYKKKTVRRTKNADTCVLPGKPCIIKKDGYTTADPVRLQALQDYYAKQKSVDPLGNETWEGTSPFTCDIGELLVSAGMIDVDFRESLIEYKHTEAE